MIHMLHLLYLHIRNPLCLFIESKLASRFAKTAVIRQKSPPEAPKCNICRLKQLQSLLLECSPIRTVSGVTTSAVIDPAITPQLYNSNIRIL